MVQITPAAALYYHNPLCTITYHAAGYVQLEWTSAATNEPELQAVYTHTLQALRHHRTPKLLTDHRRRQPLPLAAQEWIVQQWIPLAIREVGYEQCAIIENQTPLGRLAARAVGEAVAGTLRFRYFDSATEAAAWLVKG